MKNLSSQILLFFDNSWVLIFGNTSTFALQNLPSICQLGSNFVKHLFRIQIQKGGNQVKSRMEACYSELILVEDLIWHLKAINQHKTTNVHLEPNIVCEIVLINCLFMYYCLFSAIFLSFFLFLHYGWNFQILSKNCNWIW